MKYIEIFADKRRQKKNGFNWHIAKKVKGGINVLCTAQGYDTYQSAKKSAKLMNNNFKKKLDIYFRGQLVS